MLDFEEFSSGKNWAFTETLNDGFIVASSPRPEGRFEVMFHKPAASSGQSSIEYACVDGVEQAYSTVVSKLAGYAERLVRPHGERPEHVPIQLCVERGGFKPGTYEPYGAKRYVAGVFLAAGCPNAMLLAAAPFYAGSRGAETAFVQVERRNGGWTPVDMSPEFVEVVESACCQWAKDALELKGISSSSPTAG